MFIVVVVYGFLVEFIVDDCVIVGLDLVCFCVLEMIVE